MVPVENKNAGSSYDSRHYHVRALLRTRIGFGRGNHARLLATLRNSFHSRTCMPNQARRTIGGGIVLNKEDVGTIEVAKMSTVYDYINYRYQLENSKSAKKMAAKRRERRAEGEG